MKKVLSIVCLLALTVCCLFTLVSCGGPNSDPDKALEALKENGVTWAGKDETIIPGALRFLGVKNINCVVTGTGEIEEEYAHITIIYFDSADDADEYWDEVEDYAEEKKDDKAEDSEWVCEKSGKMIYYGTKNAVKAAN
ncbi:MAG: hypothetical protein J6B29_05665 [Clostridia bacterium]|nr:hypothetical protein [Clostridia bacterium]